MNLDPIPLYLLLAVFVVVPAEETRDAKAGGIDSEIVLNGLEW